MDFKTASQLGSIISRDYAENFFKLLVIYQDISASEAASRLNLHISTAQDFLEGLHSKGIVSKKGVKDKKRPYFRYSLKKKAVTITVDFTILYDKLDHQNKLKWRIREKKNSGVLFKTFSKSDYISSVHLFTGAGRTRTEKKINLTRNQGNFLYYLPFPTEPFLSVADIIKKAKIEESSIPEVLDIIDTLLDQKIIEKNRRSVV
jgi:predicted transcriptional regulator